MKQIEIHRSYSDEITLAFLQKDLVLRSDWLIKWQSMQLPWSAFLEAQQPSYLTNMQQKILYEKDKELQD